MTDLIVVPQTNQWQKVQGTGAGLLDTQGQYVDGCLEARSIDLPGALPIALLPIHGTAKN